VPELPLLLLCKTYAHQLLAVNDEEFLRGAPLAPGEVRELVDALRPLLYRLYWTQALPVPGQGAVPAQVQQQQAALVQQLERDPGAGVLRLQLLEAATRVFNQLAERNERRGFMPPEAWHWPALGPRDLDVYLDDAAGPGAAAEGGLEGHGAGASFEFSDARAKEVLSCLPQVVPFARRAAVFQSLLEKDRVRHGAGMPLGLGMGGIQLQVRRDQLVEDSFQAMAGLRGRLKRRVQVSFTSEHGHQEAGIDGGGLFKEFMDSLTHEAFDPANKLFVVTTEGLLWPNPASAEAGADHLERFEFLGRVLGKAIYERILVAPQFAGVFLNVLLGRVNHTDDLTYLDAEVHRSLVALRRLPPADFPALELFFEASTSHGAAPGGPPRAVELVPGGSGVPVTAGNVISYVHRLAHFKLNVEVAHQCRAFLRGFRDLVPLEWIRMFSPSEMQLLIGGALRPIDVADMRANTRYGGGYHDTQPYVGAFWELLASFTPQQQASFLRFCTSCPRQPLLGFRDLQPQFCIQRIPTHQPGVDEGGAARLPSSATCMNLLKLPMYDTIEELREKLLYAIEEAHGFELS